MADWTDQDTNSLLPGEPWTSAKALAAFENPVALAEGATGAPKIQAEALGAQEVNEPAMRVQQTTVSDSFTTQADAYSVTITIPRNLVFFPRVTGFNGAGGVVTDVTGVMAGGQLVVNYPGNNVARSYEVSWYRIIP